MSNCIENTADSFVLEPRITLEKGLTILEWNPCDWDIRNIMSVHIERMIEDSEWETIGLLSLPENNLLLSYIDASSIKVNSQNQVIKIHYRLRITEHNGKVYYSPSAFFDLWWKKYLEVLENPGRGSSAAAAEIFKLVDSAIKLLVKYKFRSALFAQDLNVSFVVDEARQEIFEKLFKDKYIPVKGYSGFVNFISMIGRNWIINLLRKEYKFKTEQLDETYEAGFGSPENEYIVEEEKQALYSRFRSGFVSVMEELWLNQPKYALTIEIWLKNKKLAAEDIFEGILGQSIEGYSLSGQTDEESECNSSGREIKTQLYDNIINDMVSLAENPDSISERLKRLPAGLRSSFLSEVLELGKNDARARNRARQWLYRGLTTVRVKMSRDMERFNGTID